MILHQSCTIYGTSFSAGNKILKVMLYAITIPGSRILWLIFGITLKNRMKNSSPVGMVCCTMLYTNANFISVCRIAGKKLSRCIGLLSPERNKKGEAILKRKYNENSKQWTVYSPKRRLYDNNCGGGRHAPLKAAGINFTKCTNLELEIWIILNAHEYKITLLT